MSRFLKPSRFSRALLYLLILLATTVLTSRSETVQFFSATQSTNLVVEGETFDTIRTEFYLFTLTRDKFFTGGVGMTNPIGRSLRVHWPDGLEAQAVTTGPNPRKARIDLDREDGTPFSLAALKFKLLGNTFGAGASLEIMPMNDGEDAWSEPMMLNATGFYGQEFAYVTPALSNYQSYKITLYVDFALMGLTVIDASPARPTLEITPVDPNRLEISWPAESMSYVLEWTETIPADEWTLETSPQFTIGERIAVQIQPEGAQRVYRLRKTL